MSSLKDYALQSTAQFLQPTVAQAIKTANRGKIKFQKRRTILAIIYASNLSHHPTMNEEFYGNIIRRPRNTSKAPPEKGPWSRELPVCCGVPLWPRMYQYHAEQYHGWKVEDRDTCKKCRKKLPSTGKGLVFCETCVPLISNDNSIEVFNQEYFQYSHDLHNKGIWEDSKTKILAAEEEISIGLERLRRELEVVGHHSNGDETLSTMNDASASNPQYDSPYQPQTTGSVSKSSYTYVPISLQESFTSEGPSIPTSQHPAAPMCATLSTIITPSFSGDIDDLLPEIYIPNAPSGEFPPHPQPPTAAAPAPLMASPAKTCPIPAPRTIAAGRKQIDMCARPSVSSDWEDEDEDSDTEEEEREPPSPKPSPAAINTSSFSGTIDDLQTVIDIPDTPPPSPQSPQPPTAAPVSPTKPCSIPALCTVAVARKKLDLCPRPSLSDDEVEESDEEDEDEDSEAEEPRSIKKENEISVAEAVREMVEMPQAGSKNAPGTDAPAIASDQGDFSASSVSAAEEMEHDTPPLNQRLLLKRQGQEWHSVPLAPKQRKIIIDGGGDAIQCLYFISDGKAPITLRLD